MTKVDLLNGTMSLRYKDSLDGATNFNPWNEWTTVVLKMNGLWDFENIVIQVPSNPTLLTKENMKDVKVMGIINDGVRDHIIPHITGKHTTHKMWGNLTSLF